MEQTPAADAPGTPRSPLIPPATEAALRTITTIGAVGVAVVYALGFVIVTLHHASYGFFEFSLLRPRIFAAGISFLVLSALPIVIVSRHLKVPGVPTISQSHPQHPLAANLIQASLFVVGSHASAVYIAPFFFDQVFSLPHPRVFGGWAVLLLLVALFRWYPRLSAGASVAAAGILLWAVAEYGDPVSWRLTLWFSGVGLAATYVSTLPSDWRNAVDNVLVLTLGALTFYATGLYASLRPQFGGGLPVPITIQMAQRDFITVPTTLETFLIEETEGGYYVTPARGSQVAYFMPRETVSSVRFDATRKEPPAP